jgi:predicted DNA-binding protein
MNSRLDTLADIRNVPKSELAREAIREWLDNQEDARMSRQFFSKSFQRRVDHLDWQLEVVIQMLITLAGKREGLLEQSIETALHSDLAEVLRRGSLRRAAQNRKPPAD